ncbi:MAG: hypothetical protein AB7O52_19910 [Planctomycetota bacterium]
MVALISLKMEEADERLDPQVVIKELCSEVPETQVAEGDQMQLEIDRIEASSISDEARSTVLRKLKQNANLYGPSIAFVISIPDGAEIRGHVRPVDLVFLCDLEPDGSIWSRLVHFCKRIGRGVLSVENS